MSTPTEIVIEKIVEIASEKKAEHITSIELSEESWVTDVVVLVSVSNVIHCKALMDDFSKSLPKVISSLNSDDFYDQARVSGNANSGWVILDLNSIVIHCLTTEMRDFYGLDSFFEKRGVVYHH